METTAPNQITASIFAGGAMSDSVEITPSSVVIAADSGYDIARSRGVDVDLLVGDLDSISHEGLRESVALGVPTKRYPTDKDTSDLEVALAAAIDMGATDVTIYAGEGGRFDHLIGVALGLTAESLESVNLVWKLSDSTVHRVLPNRPLEVSAHAGAIVTLLPIGDTGGVTTTGLQWVLKDSTLTRGTSRGLSNVAIEPDVSVSITTGALLVIITEEKELS